MSYKLYIAHRNSRIGRDAIEIMRSFGCNAELIDGNKLSSDVAGIATAFFAGGERHKDRLLLPVPGIGGRRVSFIQKHGLLVPEWAEEARTLVAIRYTLNGDVHQGAHREHFIRSLKALNEVHIAQATKRVRRKKRKQPEREQRELYMPL
jgi:hypothetical protein